MDMATDMDIALAMDMVTDICRPGRENNITKVQSRQNSLGEESICSL
jgi:hypothetical protein